MKTWKRFKPKNKEELRKNIEEYAKETGVKPNPDKKIVNWIIQGLLKNKEKYGEVYCPCRIVTRDKEKDKEIICPCSFHRKEIESDGHCKCLLFFRK